LPRSEQAENSFGSVLAANGTFGKECWRSSLFKLCQSSSESGNFIRRRCHLIMAKHIIGFADAKGAALLAAAGVIIVLLLPNKPTYSSFGITAIMYGLALGCLGLCAFCSGGAFLPFLPICPGKFQGSNQNPVYWKRIRKEQLEAYQKFVKTLNNSDVNRYYAQVNHHVSKELRVRFVLIEYSIAFLLVGLAFAAIYLLFLH
jgi:hypothetical protein